MHRSYFIYVMLHILLATNFFHVTECCCNSFNTITAKITSINDDEYTTNVTGCIKNATLKHLKIKVKQVYIENQLVPHLKVRTVQNLRDLILVTFSNCSTQTVKPRAFRNVPNLKGIGIVNGFLKTIPKGVYQDLPSLMIIQLTTNEINNIEDGAFANISTLQWLTVSRNKLEEWNTNWFGNNEDLVKIDFQYNLIRKIPSDAFPNMPNLTAIWFSHNEITSMEPNAFHGLNQLDSLGLSSNHLTVIDYTAFPDNFHVDKLYIMANKLNYLDRKFLNRIKMRYVQISGNPWQCSCLIAIAKVLDFLKVDIMAPEFCIDENVPVCINDEDDPCIKMVDNTLTISYFNNVKQAIATYNKTEMNACYRFD